MNRVPEIEDIRNAHEIIKTSINRTPVMTCSTLDEICGASLFFKCENFQKVGAFKARGACHVVLSLTNDEATRGVVTHSSGNHAAALSYAASIRGITANIVMPSNAPRIKVAAVEGYGGKITFCEPTLESRETTAAKIIDETGSEMVHPYDDYRIIAGQATAAVELLEDAGHLDFILTPVGGGGLVSGSALTAAYLSPGTKVIACEPVNADDAFRSFKEGSIQKAAKTVTIADGLRTMLSDKTFGIIKNHVSDIVTVTEEEIVSAMRTVWERMKIIIEPSSAVPVAAALYGKLGISGVKAGIIISGGNLDMAQLPF
jgi:threonine dehydratase